MCVLLAVTTKNPASLPASAGLESVTIQSVVFCSGNDALIPIPVGANWLWHHTVALQIATPFGAVRQTGLALFRTLESA